jgi:tRNA(Arg) A34 adenosine deaminase TadA
VTAPADTDPGSAASYFSLLLERARKAAESGNYAIAACFVQRDQVGELVVVGENTLLADRDPAGHAEMNAIRTAHRLASASNEEQPALVRTGMRDGWLSFRRSPANAPESVLYTTLEPCPMCTVAILNAGIDRVVVAAPDPLAGTLEESRLQALPRIWGDLAARLDVVWVQSDDPGDRATYLSSRLHSELIETFLGSRKVIDDHLVVNGVLDTGALLSLLEKRYAQTGP